MAPMNTPQDGDRSALAALPVHTTPWLPTGHRDQDARLLVNAMYRQRDQLLRDAPNVPVQGYEVMPISAGASGAMTCGTLISLWHASPFCRGECPSCGDQALAFTVGGSDGDWLVLGVCPFCAGVSFRAGPEAELLAELERDLLGTGYALPTAWQLLTSFGQQHTALLAALTECGEVLLPAFHYGFTPGRPETMRGWANSGRARARHWACRVTVRHAPSGARVEQTEAIEDEVARFVERHLVQTGRLPELEYDGAAGLRYCFPLISQEPVIPASVPDDDEDDEYREESDSDGYQGDVDALIASARGGAVDAAALKRVTQSHPATSRQWPALGFCNARWHPAEPPERRRRRLPQRQPPCAAVRRRRSIAGRQTAQGRAIASDLGC